LIPVTEPNTPENPDGAVGNELPAGCANQVEAQEPVHVGFPAESLFNWYRVRPAALESATPFRLGFWIDWTVVAALDELELEPEPEFEPLVLADPQAVANTAKNTAAQIRRMSFSQSRG
jgi:hypothetical protein